MLPFEELDVCDTCGQDCGIGDCSCTDCECNACLDNDCIDHNRIPEDTKDETEPQEQLEELSYPQLALLTTI